MNGSQLHAGGGANPLAPWYRARSTDFGPILHVSHDLGSANAWWRQTYFGALHVAARLLVGPTTLVAGVADFTVYADTTGGAVTYDLPSNYYPRVMAFVKLTADANPFTVRCTDSATIQGATSAVLATQYAALILQAFTSGSGPPYTWDTWQILSSS